MSGGHPWLDQKIEIVDPETCRPLPEGEVGEVWISGPSVAGGYWNRPEESARTFGARLEGREETFLRTGDLGFLSGGALYLTGRAKDLIILRGRNLYPQDLELTAERSHGDLRPGCGAAFAVEVEGKERLVLVQEVERDAEKRWQRGMGSAAEVTEAVRRAVAAEHEAAVHAVVLLRAGSVPKTSSGKIQRRACRADFLAGRLEAVETWTQGDTTAGEAPRTPTEEKLERIWAEVLGLERVGIERDLFELGADSLRATQLLARVNEAFGVGLTIDSLFGAPSIAELATLLEQEDPAAAELPRLERVPRDGELPLAFAQRRLWFLHQLDPANPVHNIAASIRLRGRLDVAALSAVFDEVVRRHEALRTGFASPGEEPVQRVLPAVRLPLPVIDLSALGVESQPLEAESQPLEVRSLRQEALSQRTEVDSQRSGVGLLRQRVGSQPTEAESQRQEVGRLRPEPGRGPLEAARAALARLPFPLETGPFLRTALVRFSEDEHELILSLHHIASDGGSLAVLVREMGVLYEGFAAGRPSPLPELPVQYADFAVWQRRRLDAGALEAGLAYWRQQLGGELPVVELPADRPRPAVLSYRGAHAERLVPARLVERLEALAREGRATRFMALLAGFSVLLHRYTGLDDLVVGTPIDGRNRVELEGLIGVFLNNLVLRTRLDGRPGFRELLARVRRTALDAYAHQEVPFERLVDELRPERDLSRAPLFQVMFVGQNAPFKRLELPGLTLQPREVDLGTARFDLSLSMGEADDGWLGIWKYSTDLFDAATMQRMAGHLESLLAAAVAEPDRPVALLPMLSEAERRQVVEVWNDTAAPFPHEATLHGLFEEQVRRTPDAVALEAGGQRLSYEELNRRADRLASHLRRLGVEADVLVGIAAERSVEMVVGLMGILKAGGAYVPMDPSYPQDRIAYMLEDSGVGVLLTQSHLELPEARAIRVQLDEPLAGPAERFDSGALPGSLAYCIYTSGSTGRPKGAGIPHRGIVNRLNWMQSAYRLTAEDRVLQKTPFSFDVSVWEFFWPLLTGARLVMAPPGAHQDAARLAELIRDHGITTLHFVPSMLQVFLEQDGLAESCRSVRRVFASGEALPFELKERFFARVPGTALHNLYGPTEASVDVTYHACKPGGRTVPIGRPIDNTSILILDRESQPVPVGVPGELHIGGVNLARGYLGRPELTAERFVPNPFGDGDRLYRTGDLARLRPDGEVEYLGRLDFQVKIRGVRIELGEIEAELSRHPGVREVCVLAREGRLVAYLVPGGEDAPRSDELRSYLRGRLPEAMVPSAFVVLPAFPLNPSGKVDRKALPAPEADRPERDGYEEPRTELEKRLADMWRELLGIERVERVGIHDSFFELGGDSIQAAMFINRLQKELGQIVYVMALFDAPTVASFAEYLATEYPGAAEKPRAVRGSLEVEPALETLRSAVSLRLGRTPGAEPDEIETGRPVPPVVFLLSPFRSGSTLLRVMLAGHPRLFAPPELELLAFRTMDERRGVYSGRNRFAVEGLLRAVMDLHGCGADRAREIVAEAEREGLPVSAFYRRLQEWSGGRLVVDKTPSYALDLPTLRRAERMFENPLYVHLVRHPRATIGSYLEAKMDQVYGFPFPPEEQAELVWTLAHRNILAFLEEVPAERRHRLRFEDLVKDPRGSMEALSRFLGLEMEEAMLQPYQGERMTDGLHAGTRMMGDPKFHQHRGIDASVADRWQQAEGTLAAETWSLAVELGYPDEVVLRPVPREPGAELPLSFAQQRLWFLDQLEPGSPLYNIPAALRISGPLSIPALEQTLREIVRRHEVLRTVFAEKDGRPEQVILPAILPEIAALLSQVDLSGLPVGDRETELLRLAREEARTPFDLSRGPMLRVRLLRLGQAEHAALVTMHHVASDGWSLRVFVRELAALYEAFSQGRPSPLPELPIQYADFAAWQRAWLRGGTLEAELSWWRERLAGMNPVLDLPTDRQRPAVPSRRGASRPLRLPHALASGLERLSQEGQATLFMALLAGLQTVLHRYTGSVDVPVGTTIAGRNRAEIEGLIGFFVNSLVLRTDLSGAPGFQDLLARVRTAALGAYGHQDLPFERLVEELQPERSLAHTPLFQVMLSFQNLGAVELDLPGLDLRLLELESGTAKFDLTFALRSEAGGIAGSVEYSEELFDQATVDRLIGHFERLLAGAVAEPERSVATLPMLTESEWRQVVEVWNDTAVPFPEETSLHGLFEEQVRRTPEAVALEYGGRRLTYDGLNRRANRLARHLRRLGSDGLVGIAVERSLEMIVGLLGILKAGAAYVPLDPSYPQDRLAYMLEDSGVGILLTQSHLQDNLPLSSARVVLLDDPALFAEPLADRDPASGALPESLAYAIYTSGSTGKPKGTGVPHRGIVNRLSWGRSTYELGADDRVLQKTPFSFDVSVWELFWPLATGARLVMSPPGAHQDPSRLAELIRDHGITTLHFVPSMLQVFLEQEGLSESCRSVRQVFCSGEALPFELKERFFSRLPGRELHNLYGPTEASVEVTYHACEPGGSRPVVPIGRPVHNTSILLLDREAQPVPVGVPGELHIGGVSLARGYLGRPDLTAERFVPSPFGDGERLYRTGDLARWRDGEVEYLGRLDFQVKIRGVRIELGEIEAALASHPGVREAVVTARDSRLVAYLVASGEPELRPFLRERLPEAMVPSAFVFLEALPLNANGKVDRKALPAPEWVGSQKGFVAPRDTVEQGVAEIWAELLPVERVGALDSFFDLGGHSLLATQAVSRLRDRFGVELPLRRLFEAPSVAALAEILRREGGVVPAPPLVPVERDGDLPLSYAQERLWFLDQLEPGSPFYNMPAALRLRGHLSVPVLAEALEEIVRRHEALRTVFSSVDGKPVQRVLPAGPFSLNVEEAEETDLRRLAREEAATPFDLGRGPLLRARLVRLGGEDYALLLTLHHIAGDGWSLGVLVREVSEIYSALIEGRRPELPELPVQYADFACWQRSWLTGAVLESELGWWRRTLAGAPPVLELPSDRPRPAVQSYRGGTEELRLPADLSESLLSLGRQEKATPFMTLLAVFEALLQRYAGRDDVVVGTPVANRNRSEIEGLIGFFVNTLVLRTDLSGDPSFRGLLGRVREAALGAYAHQEVPFEKLVEELQPERSLSHSPLFQVMFSLQEAPLEGLELPGLSLSLLGGDDGIAKFDLTLTVTELPDGLHGEIRYSADLFEASTVRRMIGHFERLLAGAVAEPERSVATLPMLTESEWRQVVEVWNDTAVSFPEETSLHGLFEEQVRRTPEAVALEYGGQRLTYDGLNRRANRLARHLRRLGVGNDDLVGIAVERSLEMVVGLLGILKAGAAYVPLDPSYPQDRLAYMLEDSGVGILLTQGHLRDALPASAARVVLLDDPVLFAEPLTDRDPASGALPESLAYAIYTSGSTGKPKGTGVPHRGIVNRLSWGRSAYELGADDRVLQKTPFSFDVSVWELFWPLVTGARLVMSPPGAHQDPSRLAELIRDHGITTLHFVPSMLQVFLEQEGLSESCRSVRQVFCSGEALPFELKERFFSRLPGRELHNLYGPTEASVEVTYHACEPGGSRPVVPIGRPIHNTSILVLDREDQPVPVGVPGELHIGGVSLARGYLGRPDLTAERFVPNPFGDGERLYRTGDLARWREGEVEYLGRLDFQVKIRGVRVELGEIEAALASHPVVREAVVTARDSRLVAYLVASGGEPDLRSFLRERLPEAMVPSAFVFLSALPLNANGKVDRKALPAPEWSGGGFVAPRDTVEQGVAEIWAELLPVERVGALDSFFDLGGHSLLATQAVSRLRDRFGVELPLRRLFEAPSVAALAEILRREGGVVPAPPLVPVARDGDLPLSYAQERLWFLDQLEPGSPFYNMPAALRLRGHLSVPVLAEALEEIVRRHEALRTVFSSVDGKPVQTVLPAGPFPLPVEELEESDLRRLAREEAATPFDLGRGPLLRARLVRLGDEDYALLLTLHHIAGDGWSLGVLVREVSEIYSARIEGRRPELPELPVQYADFACWQRSWLTGEVLESELGWWRQTLAGAPPVLELPSDRPRPAVQTYRGGTEELRLPAELSESLLSLGRQEKATPFMTLLAVFEVLLQRYAGCDDIVVGTPVANRNRSEIEGLIGFFVNTLVLRTDLAGDPSVRGLLGRVRETALGAYAHQEVPFEKLVEELQPERSLSHSPLFQVMFSLQEAPLDGLELPGLSLRLLGGDGGIAKFDLTLTVAELPGGLHGAIEYSADLFDAATIRRMAGHLETLLRAAASGEAGRLSELSLLTPAELREVLAHGAGLPEAGDLLETIARQAERNPGAVALVAPEGAVTYGELIRRVDALALRLRSQGVGPEVRVGLGLERSVEAVVSLLAVMRAGGAYLPLPPGYPREWMEHVLADSGAALLLTEENLGAELPDDASTLELPWPAPDQAAYVLYTSGSTGRPKGVQVPRRALSHHAAAIVESFGLRPADRVLQFAALGFDVAAEEIFPTLAAGATLVLWSEKGAATAAELQRFIARERLTVLNLPTPYWREWVSELLREGAGLPGSLRLVVAGSEAVQPSDVEAWRRLAADRPVEWRNAYGLTEATITSTTYTLPRGGTPLLSVPIGRPLPGVRAYVLDRQGGLLPAGVPGELCLGGPGLARGYLGRPDLTAQRFVPDPFAGGDERDGRLYRTGDLVRRLPGGDFEYLGRIDHQVKIRGVRIEPGEVEATLAGHPAVAQAVVLARETGTGDRRLVAYVAPSEGHAAAAGELRSFLLGRLPQVMVPSSFAVLDALPLLPNGKLDRRALLAMDGEGPRSERPFVAPRTLTEQKLVEIWGGVLGQDRIGVHDDFFELGGHSLLATQVVAHANRAFQMELPLRLLFERPTLAALAEGIEEALLQELEGLTEDEATQLLALQNQEELG